jgi:hypothetical protein
VETIDRTADHAKAELLRALREVTRCLAWHAQQHPVGMDCIAVSRARAVIDRAIEEHVE